MLVQLRILLDGPNMAIPAAMMVLHSFAKIPGAVEFGTEVPSTT